MANFGHGHRNPNSRLPVFQRDYTYANASYFSAIDSDLSGVNASGIFDGLSGVNGQSYIIWGWQTAYHEQTESGNPHVILAISDNSEQYLGLMHGSDEDNVIISLPQPIILASGSEVRYIVLDEDMKSNDVFYGIIWYSLVDS
jgi:hypothetical protein